MPQSYPIELPKNSWRAELAKRKAQWTDRNLDEVYAAIEDYVYLKALNGSRLNQLAKEFGADYVDFRAAFGGTWALGNGRMKEIIAVDTLRFGLKSNQPVSKIWLGKALGGLGESSSTDVEAEDTGSGVTINVRTIRKADVIAEKPEADGE